MISDSLLSSIGFLFDSGDIKPLGELCSLLLFSITAWRDFATADSAPIIPRNVFEMMRVLYESASKIFATTQLGSVAPSNQVSQQLRSDFCPKLFSFFVAEEALTFLNFIFMFLF